MFECTTFPVALAGQHKVSLHLGDVQLREFCYSQITFFERFWRLEKTSCLFSLFVSCLFQNRLAMKLKVKKICSQVPHRDALPWWSQCMVSSDATNRKTTKWDCQIGRWRFASASTNSFCYLSISFTFIYFSPWPTTGGEANNAAISCVPGDEKGSEQKLTKCWCVLMHINIYYWESRTSSHQRWGWSVMILCARDIWPLRNCLKMLSMVFIHSFQLHQIHYTHSAPSTSTGCAALGPRLSHRWVHSIGWRGVVGWLEDLCNPKF